MLVTPTKIWPTVLINVFFLKILNIHDDVSHFSTSSKGASLVEGSYMSLMDGCELLTETDIRRSLKRSSNALCTVDPLPTWLAKRRQHVLISRSTTIVG